MTIQGTIDAQTERGHKENATLSADMFLLHAPSVYDFRDRDDVLFAYLSDSDSVNVTSIYEMYPIGFFSIKQRLQEHGFAAEIINVASLMLMYPNIDVDKLIACLDAPVFGFDLHWMAQCHGSIELAKRIKKSRPDALTVFGGISATYFADELIQYPAVDVVVKGYDTLAPLTAFMEMVRAGTRRFDAIPNILYKESAGIRSNEFTHKPSRYYNDATVDWSFYRDAPNRALTSKMIMTLPNTGCAMDCPWCGGSRYAYRQMMGVKKTMIQKDHTRIVEELRSMGDAAKVTSIYALQCYSETKARLHQYLDAVKEMQYKNVFFEQFHLTPRDTLEKMGRSTNAYIMLSPESHDREISRLAGRGNYSMKEMEEWIPNALDAGIAGIMVWFFIGMPKQTARSVLDTVDYAEALLRKFPGGKVLPLICPMVPFLDPGSRFFEHPEKHGYRIFHKTLEEHRQAMIEPLWHKRLNYETEWLSRRELQDVSYEAIGRLVTAKADFGLFPKSIASSITNTIAETTELLSEMEVALDRDGVLPPQLKDVVRAYNRKILAYSSDQIVPTHRPFGGRWFDDFTVPAHMIAACTSDAMTQRESAPTMQASEVHM
jgi:clorobiocin biosynthesis protein CloN6